MILRPNSPDDQVMRARSAAREALLVAGIATTGELDLVFRSRQVVLLARAQNTSRTNPIKSRRQDQLAVRVFGRGHCAQEATREVELARALYLNGGPVAAPLHEPIDTQYGLVGLWQFVDRGRSEISMQAWGKALKQFHTSGQSLSLDPYSPTSPAHAGLFEEKSYKRSRPKWWPEGIETELLDALTDAEMRTIRAGRKLPRGLVHGDLHRLNVEQPKKKQVYFFDLEFAGQGSLAHDFSFISLGVKRFGWPHSALDQFRRGYGPNAPSDSDLEPFTRLRELLFCYHNMACSQLGIGELMERQLEYAIQVIREPEAKTPLWVNVGNPPVMDVAGIRVSGPEL